MGVLFDDGELVVYFCKAVGGEGVGFCYVGFYVAVGSFGVGDEGGDELFVAGVGEVEGLSAVGVGFEGVDAV